VERAEMFDLIRMLVIGSGGESTADEGEAAKRRGGETEG